MRKTSNDKYNVKILKFYKDIESLAHLLFVTMTSVWKIRVAFVAFGAIAQVAWSIPGVHTPAVAAEACVSACLVQLGFFTRQRHRPVSYRPVHHHGYSPSVCVIELGRADVRSAEIECLRLHQHGIATAAEVPNLACVETPVEADLVVAHPLGYRCLATAHAGAGSIC